jgi:hypothetical protein
LWKGPKFTADIVGREFLEREVSFMYEHLVIANFLEGQMEEHVVQEWVVEISEIIVPG